MTNARECTEHKSENAKKHITSRKARAKQIEYHELLLGESDPELVGDAILVKDALKHALGRLLAQLHEVGAKQVCAGKTGTEREIGNQMNTEVNQLSGSTRRISHAEEHQWR